MKKKKTKRRTRKDCEYYDAYSYIISCNNPEVKKCVCTNICKLFVPYVAPLVEKHFDN